MAAELVETNRLWARRVATIQPAWAERIGAHLVRRSYGEPRWDARRGAAVTTETVTLYGLPIVEGRTIAYDRVDRAVRPPAVHPPRARRRRVDGATTRFVERNRQFLERVRALEARVRRGGLLDDDAVLGFYDGRVGADVTSTRQFDRWWKDVDQPRPPRPHRRRRSKATAAFRPADYPDRWRDGDLDLPLTYRFDPGGPLDGVTVHVPLTALNQFSGDGLDWQIPGHRAELVGGARAHAAQGRPPRADPGRRDDDGRARTARPAARPARRRPRRRADRRQRRAGRRRRLRSVARSRPTCG